MLDRNYIPRTPAGSNNEARRFIDTHNILHPARRPVPQPVPPVGIGGGIDYKTPKIELDPSVAVAKKKIVYLSPNNPLCTAGLMDLFQGIMVKAPAGTWISVQAVPAAAMVGGVLSYNVPQLPYPGASGTPTGSPLAGDLDGAQVFWHFVSQEATCF
jgi:hypothetical protein